MLRDKIGNGKWSRYLVVSATMSEGSGSGMGRISRKHLL
jgi:hypothetical protein